MLCYCSHPAPGAFGMELLSSAPQNHPVHPTQRVYKHAELSLEQTKGSNTQFTFQWLSRSRQQDCVYWGAYFTHQVLLKIFKPFLPEDWGRTWPAKHLWCKRTTCTAYLEKEVSLLFLAQEP